MMRNGSGQAVTVTLGEVGDKSIFRNLIQLYRYDLSTIEGRDLDAHGLYDYAYLDHYWTPEGRAAGRRPFLVRANGQLAGFVLKAAHSYLGRTGGHNIAEFFILRKWRRQGIGRQVAVAIFNQFPGPWEVAQQRDNAAAQAFWRTVIHVYTNGAFEEIDARPPAWEGPVLCFTSRDDNRPSALTTPASH